MHPYRERRASTPRPDDAGADAEDCIVHTLIGVVGGIGIVVGAVYSRPTELTLGALFSLLALRALWHKRARRRASARRSGAPKID